MADKLILPDYILCHFLTEHLCSRCGRSGRPQTLLYPTLRRSSAIIELNYPMVCSCGGCGHVTITLPILLFGFILASVAFIEAYRRAHKSKATMPVQPGRSELFVRMVEEFDGLAAASCASASAAGGSDCSKEVFPGSGPDDSDLRDRLMFGFSAPQWAEFLRRMGLGAGDSDKGESNNAQEGRK